MLARGLAILPLCGPLCGIASSAETVLVRIEGQRAAAAEFARSLSQIAGGIGREAKGRQP